MGRLLTSFRTSGLQRLPGVQSASTLQLRPSKSANDPSISLLTHWLPLHSAVAGFVGRQSASFPHATHGLLIHTFPLCAVSVAKMQSPRSTTICWEVVFCRLKLQSEFCRHGCRGARQNC